MRNVDDTILEEVAGRMREADPAVVRRAVTLYATIANVVPQADLDALTAQYDKDVATLRELLAKAGRAQYLAENS